MVFPKTSWRLFLLILWMLLPFFIHAQSAVLRGQVKDGLTGNPLSYVTISIEGTGTGTFSDLDGFYRIGDIEPGEYILILSYLGYGDQQITVNLGPGEEKELNVQLKPANTKLETVVVTAQAVGQRAAINQQVNANSIVNVVSKEKLQELPDQNAAESVGRIAGVSLQREGGEATKVSIRGLSPRYNSITINGERIPATDGNDRSVDLSMISTDALEGIEVFKAITPDQDGDAIGGTVNFVIKNAEEGLRSEIRVLGGYNNQEADYGQLRANASVSNRFFNNKLGVIAGLNYQRANRSSDLLTASYVTTGEDQDQNAIIATENLNLADRQEIRIRGGANLSVDYRLPKGSIQVSSFYGLLDQDELRYRTRYRPEGARKEYELRQRQRDQTTWNNTLSATYNLDFLNSQLDFRASYAITENNTPNERTWRFREDGAFLGSVDESDLVSVVASAKNDLESTFFQQARIDETIVDTRKATAQLDYKIPFRVSKDFLGNVKMGVKIRDQFRDRNSSRQWSAFGAINNIAADFPDRFALNRDDRITVSQFFGSHSADPYLDNRFPFDFGSTLDLDALNAFNDTYSADYYSEDERLQLQNYESDEQVRAAYAMLKLELFNQRLTLIPGVRVEQTETNFSGLFGRSFESEGQVFISAQDTAGNNVYTEFLPMVQLRYKLTDWMDIRAASTRTLARPNFFDLIPWQEIDDINAIVQRGNPELQHTVAQNYDLQFSFYNKFGLLTIGGFVKNMDNVDFLRVSRDSDPNSATRGYQLITRENLETRVEVLGIEIDLQSQLSFLPKPFNGILVGGNVSFMQSQTQFPLLEVVPGPPPFFIPEIINTFRDGILPDQPDHVINLNIGYEIKGFSARLSMIRQGRTLQFVGSREELDGFFSAFTRWDLAVNQRINDKIRVYFNLNNFTNTPEVVTLGDQARFPLEEEFFGWTADFGIRYRLIKE
ncbi:MAG: TonB-dependent receptor [Bacteroidota bacterium]